MKSFFRSALSFASLGVLCGQSLAAGVPFTFNDPKPQRYELTARASQIDPRAKPHPELEFVFERGGQQADGENASVANEGLPKFPSFPLKALRVIYLFQSGAPSQMDLVDPKPEMAKRRWRGRRAG